MKCQGHCKKQQKLIARMTTEKRINWNINSKKKAKATNSETMMNKNTLHQSAPMTEESTLMK